MTFGFSEPQMCQFCTMYNVLENWIDRMGYCKVFLTGRFNLSNKTILLKKYP